MNQMQSNIKIYQKIPMFKNLKSFYNNLNMEKNTMVLDYTIEKVDQKLTLVKKQEMNQIIGLAENIVIMIQY